MTSWWKPGGEGACTPSDTRGTLSDADWRELQHRAEPNAPRFRTAEYAEQVKRGAANLKNAGAN